MEVRGACGGAESGPLVPELVAGIETGFAPHDEISEEQYDAAPPQTKRNIDELVERGVLVASEEA